MSSPPVYEDENDYGQQLTYDPEFKGPVKHRSCTDVICLFLFIAFLAGWVVVGIFAIREGDPKVLLYPTDSLGNMCGTGELSDKPYLLFFDLRKCVSPKVIYSGCPTPQVCVSECPQENFIPSTLDPNHQKVKDKLVCEYDVDKNAKSLEDLLEEGHCATLYLKSSPVLGRCIPDMFFNSSFTKYVKDSAGKIITDEGDKLTNAEIKNATSNIANFLKVTEISAKIFADFKIAWKEMLIGFCATMVLSLIWIVLMRWIACPMIWLSIILILGFTVYGCYYSTDRYIKMKNVEGVAKDFSLTWNIESYLSMPKTWLAFAIISGVAFAILFLVLLFLRKRISIAIALIEQASRAVGTMPSTLLFPIFPYALQFIFLGVWIVIALFIASSGKATFVFADVPAGMKTAANGSSCDPAKYNSTGEGIKCMFQTYGLKNNLYSAHAYNLFGMLWGVCFSIGLGQLALAGTFSSYYWTRDKSNDIPCCSILASILRTCRYHLGSIAFGSLLIAITKFIRVMLEYINRKCKKYDNKCTQFILWCLRCCFWCLEQFLKFISKNAYIMVSIYGKNFCSSAKQAFMLLMRNIVRVVVLDKITEFLLFLGKLVVVVTSGVLSFYYFSTTTIPHTYTEELNYNIAPPIVITIAAYIIATAFFNVYEMAVDTLFLCFLEDCERNDGSPQKPYYMSKDLMKLLHKKNKFRDVAGSPTKG